VVKSPATTRRIVGFALLASAGVMGFVALLFGGRVLPVPDETRLIVGLALGAAALIDGFIGLRFVMSSTE
jgi:hypothetical protein